MVKIKHLFGLVSLVFLAGIISCSDDVGGGTNEYYTSPSTSSTLKAPVISPAAGDYSEGFKEITLFSDSANSEIYYTTDGSAPTNSSSRYTGQFRIIGSKTVKAIAYSGNSKSSVTTAVFNLNVGKSASQLGVISGNLSLASNLSDEIKQQLADSTIYITSPDLPGFEKQGKVGESFYIEGLDTAKFYSFYFSNKASETPITSRAASVQFDLFGKPIVSIQIGTTPSEGSGTDLGEVTLKPTGTITGIAKKYGEDGSEESDHAGITVFIPGTSFSAYTDKNGNFSMTNVPQGNHTIRAMYAGYAFSEQENVILSTSTDDEPTVEISEEFALYYAKGTVKGSVLLSDKTSGFSGIDIVITDSANTHSYSANTTATGAWSISDVTPGTYSIEFHKDGYVDQTVNDIIVAGAKITTVPRVVLKEDGGSISGSVSVGTLGRISGVSVIAEREVDSENSAKTYYAISNASGEFSFASVAPGVYTVTATYAGYKSVSQPYVSVAIGEEVSLAELSITEKSTYSVTGSCVLAGMESGFEGTNVLLQSVTDSNVSKSTTTNAEGTFTISDIDAGSYILTFSRQGFITNSSVTVEVGAKAISVAESVVLQSNAGTVSGTVTLESAESYEGISILVSQENSEKTYSTVTDSTGHFAVAGVVPGTYRVQATKGGYNTGISDPFTVSSGATSSPSDMMLKISLRSLYGTVKLEGKTDFTGVRITATNINKTTEIYSALSNKDGFYALSGMTPGEYILSYSYEGYRSPDAVTASLVDESSANIDEIELKKATGKISGIVQLDGTSDYSDITVSLVGTDYTYTTESDGTYSFTVPTGNYIGGVRFEKEGYQLSVQGETLIVLADRNNVVQTVSLHSNTGIITGEVALESATEYDGISIVIYNDKEETAESYSADSDIDGHFAVSGVVPGTYRIQATKKGFAVGKSDPFIVSAGSKVTVPSMQLTISRRAIYGTVTLEDKIDAKGVRITATKTTSTTEIYSALSNKDGSYTLSGMTPGEYILSFSYEGYKSPEDVSASVLEESSVTLEKIKLEKATGVISGIVQLDGTSDYSDITVTLVGSDYSYVTEADGTYSFTVPTGNYVGGVRFEKLGYQLVVKGETIIVLPDRSNVVPTVSLHSNTGVVKGSVTLESAATHEDIDIVVYQEDDTTIYYSSVTDSEGHFAISGIAAGTYRVQATKKGFTVGKSDPFVVSVGGTVTSPSLKLSISRRALYGTIKLEGRTDATGVRITATKTTSTTEIYSALSNQDGFYALSGMTPGEYILSYSYEGYRSSTSSSISLSEDTSKELDEIELSKATGKISGIVNLEGCTDHSGVKVSIVGTDYTFITEANGVYEFTVPSGNYPGGVRFEKEDYKLAARAETIPVLTDSTYGVLTVEMKATANTVKGVTTIAGADDFSGITVTVDGLEPEKYSATTDENGNWELLHIPLGYRTIRFSRTNVPDVTVEKEIVPSDYVKVERLEMIPDSASVKGFVFLDGMTDHAGIIVTAKTVGKDDISVRTTSDGAFTLNNLLASVDHTIVFSKDGWDSQSVELEDFEPLEVRTIGQGREYVLKDTTAPTWGSTPIVINSGANFAKDTKLHVDLTPVEKGSGIEKMSVQVTRTHDGETSALYPSTYNWQNYQIGFDYDLGQLPDQYVGNGTYTLYITLRDKSGNVSATTNKAITITDLVTSLAGVLTGDKLHLTEENSPYIVESDCLVSEDATLVIDPGVEIRFASGVDDNGNTKLYSISVSGSIEARGTAEKKILFTKADSNEGKEEGYWDYSSGNSVWKSSKCYWNGIAINGGSVSTENTYKYVSGNIMEYCEFEYANTPLTIKAGAYINKCHFHDCTSYVNVVLSDDYDVATLLNNDFENGISLSKTNIVINNNIRSYFCSDGMYSWRGKSLVMNNDFKNADIRFEWASFVAIQNNKIENSLVIINTCLDDVSCLPTITNNNFVDCPSPIVSTSTEYKSGKSYNFTHNYWGAAQTEELNSKGNEENISFISDYYNDFKIARVDYSNWATEPFENCGYSETGFVAFDYAVNGYDFGSSSGYYPESTDTHLTIELTPQYYENPITQMRLAQSYEDLKAANWQSYSANTTFTVDKTKLVNGAATLYVQVKDSAGNCSSAVVHNIPYDTPVCSLSVEDGALFGSSTKKQSITYSATDLCNITAYTLSLDGSKIASNSGNSWGTSFSNTYTLPLAYMAAGSHTLTMTATDSAGNTGETSISFTINRTFNESDVANISYDTTTGQLLKDASTVHLWHLDADGSESLGTAAITEYAHTNGGFEGAASRLSGSVALDISTNAFTVEFWTRGRGQVYMNKESELGINNYYNSVTSYDNFMRHYYTTDDSVTDSRLWSTAAVKTRGDDQWHYWAYVYGSTYSAVYCDGICVAYEDGYTHTLNTNSNDLSISASGIIDELRISSSARSADEISAYYKTAKPILDANTGSLDVIVW